MAWSWSHFRVNSFSLPPDTSTKLNFVVRFTSPLMVELQIYLPDEFSLINASSKQPTQACVSPSNSKFSEFFIDRIEKSFAREISKNIPTPVEEIRERSQQISNNNHSIFVFDSIVQAPHDPLIITSVLTSMRRNSLQAFYCYTSQLSRLSLKWIRHVTKIMITCAD